MKLIPRRNQTTRDLEKILPGTAAAIDGASDREIEQIVNRSKLSHDSNWNMIGTIYGFRG
jgi:hypothetical protein